MFSPLVLVTVLLSNAAPENRETARKELREQLETLAGPLVSTARVSLQVESLDDGTVLFSKGGNELLNIASNTKLFSTAAALATLGPDYEFTTELFAPDLRKGKTKTLFVRGKGDPTLTTERLYGIAAELLHAGLREVAGDLVLDETWFDPQRTPRGYDQEDTDFAYMAPTGALSLHANAVGLYVLPARPGVKPQVTVDPPSDYVTVDATRLTGQCPRPDLGVKSRPDREKQKLIVFGCLVDPRAGARVWRKIDQPAFYFGHTFKRVLADRGIQVKGKVRLGVAPKEATPLLVARSESLADVLKKINKRSINFAAETLLKTMAAEKVGTPATFASGLNVVADFLERDVGIPRGTYVMDNGSGLNDANRFTSAQVNKLLRYMSARFDLAPDYLASLGIAGIDGTLRNRFGKTDAAGNLRGKTGTLAKVTAVSGYVRAGSGERFTFSLIANDTRVRVAEVRRGLDSLGAAVAHAGWKAPEPGPADSPVDDIVRRKLESYSSLQTSPAFLRTAFASENDPAVRLLLAESIVAQQNDPAPLMLALELDATQVAHVQTVFRTLRRPVPGIDAAVELASEGNLDATARLVRLAPAFEADSEATMAFALSRVAARSPKTLLYTLRAAAGTEQLSASRLLVRQLATKTLADAPFVAVSNLLEREAVPAFPEAARAVAPASAAPATVAIVPLGG